LTTGAGKLKLSCVKTAIMVIPNKPWEAPWVLRYYDTVEEAKEQAYLMSLRRPKNSPERYKVNGFTY
jgi:hypothetical protein